ncbi:MAG: hypothetical protein U0703_10475 [Anaerolineae bacterium]
MIHDGITEETAGAGADWLPPWRDHVTRIPRTPLAGRHQSRCFRKT